MRDKTKIGYSCYDKKMHGFENPNEKFKRWRRNLKFAYTSMNQEFSGTIEMIAKIRRLSCSLSGSGICGTKN